MRDGRALGALLLTAGVFVACGPTPVAANTKPHAEPRWAAPHYIEPQPTPTPVLVATPEPTVAPTQPARALPRPTLPAPQPVAPAPPVATPNYNATTMQVLVNQDRAAAGLPPLAWSSCLGGNAQSVANRIAANGALYEPPSDLRADVDCRLGPGAAGENEAWYSAGINDAAINTAYMNSPDHRANILNPNYRFIGTAWATASNGYGYNAEEFAD